MTIINSKASVSRHSRIFLIEDDFALASLVKNALLRAFSNLLANAIRHAKSKILVTFKLSDQGLGLERGQHFVLIVEDDGDGVAEEQRTRILEPFVQLDNDARDSNLGHGFGLAIVSKVAQWHNGMVVVGQSTRINGASFSLSWPVDFKPSDTS